MQFKGWIAVSLGSCSKKMQLVLVACKTGRAVQRMWMRCFNGGYGNNKSLKMQTLNVVKKGVLNREIGIFLLAIFSVEDHLKQCPIRAKLLKCL